QATPTVSVTNSPVTYDGSAQAVVVAGSVPGIVSNVTPASETDAGTYPVTADFAPTDATNYSSLTGASAGNFVISQATLTVSGITDNKIYDGAVTPNLNVTLAALVGVLPADALNVTLVTTGAAVTDYGSATVGVYTVSVSGLTLSGSAKDNYALTQPTLTDATISQATPTLSVTNSPVTYTGAAQAPIVSGSVPGLVSNVTPASETDAGTYPVTADFAPTDATNYSSLTGAAAGNFVINQATPTVSVTNSPVTYDGSAQAVVVAGSVPGIVSNVTPASQTDAGTYPVTADFAPTDATNYSSLTGASAGNFVINQATPTVSVTVGTYTYDGTAQGPGVADVNTGGSTGTVTMSYAGTGYGPSATPPTDAGSYTATASVTADSNYNAASSSATAFSIDKADPDVTTWPTASAITYGQTLADSMLSGGVVTPTGNFAFTTPTTAPNAGTADQDVTFTPDDTGNYNTAAGVASVTVNKAALDITATNDSKTYGGTKTYGAGSTAFTSSGLKNGETIGSVTITASGGTAATDAAGTYNLTPSAATGGTFTASNYTIAYHNGTLTVKGSPPTVTSGLTPGTTEGVVDEPATFTFGVSSDALPVTYTWKWGDGTTTTTTEGSATHPFTAPGIYTVKVTATDSAGLSTTSDDVRYTVVAGATPPVDTDICAGLSTVPLRVQQVAAKLRFPSSLSKDALSLKALLALNDGFNPDGQVVQWDIGGIRGETTLNAKGNSPRSTSVKVSLRYKKPAKGQPFTARTGKLAISIKSVSLDKLVLAGIAALNSTSASTKGDPATIQTCVVLKGHQAYHTTGYAGVYKAKKDKGGAFKAQFKL
ncbi:MAG: PKD domain-containing protein, partial [Planctomycetota bacterium]|nr:PKD domain-containing protein [Planctomycetota bacterium]